MKIPRRSIAFSLIALGSLAGALWAEDEIDRFAKRVKYPSASQVLAAGGDKALAKDPVVRRKWILDTAAKAPPLEAALPLLMHVAASDEDDRNRVGATRLWSHAGLACDREEVRARILPEVRRHLAVAPAGPEERYALEELVRLGKFFRLDKDVARELERVFSGADFNLRGIAFEGICDLKDPVLDAKLVRPCCMRVLAETKGFSLYDRRRAIRELAARGDKNVVPIAAAALTGEGPIAIESAIALADLRDPRSLDALRKIDRTAVFELRAQSFRARCRLDDATCADELAASLEEENGALVTRMIEAFADTKNARPKSLLESFAHGKFPEGRANRLTLTHKEADLAKERRAWARAAVLALFGRGEAPGEEMLEEALSPEPPASPATTGPSPAPSGAPAPPATPPIDPKEIADLAEKAMRCENPACDAIITTVLAETRCGERARTIAAQRAGEHKLKDAAMLLFAIANDGDEPGGLRAEAHVSRFEFGEAASLQDCVAFLQQWNDVRRAGETIEVAGEKAGCPRYTGSAMIAVLDRIERTKDAAFVPLLDELLRPDTAQIGSYTAPGKESPSGANPPTTTVRDPKTTAPSLAPPPPSFVDVKPRRLKDQFVRRRVVEVAAKIGGEQAARVLGRGLQDLRSEVRAAALREIGRLSGKFTLAPGAEPSEEDKTLKPALSWLAERTPWPVE